MKNIHLLVKKTLDILSEIEMYHFYKKNLKRQLSKLFADYQAGRYDYFTYEKHLKRLLKGKTEEEMMQYYDSYILGLFKRIEAYNSELFYEAYQDHRYGGIKIVKKVLGVVPSPPKVEHKPTPKIRKHEKHIIEPKKIKKKEKLEPAPKPESVKHLPEHKPVPEITLEPSAEPETAEPSLVEVKPSLFGRISSFFRRIFVKKEIDAELEKIRGPSLEIKKLKEIKKKKKRLVKAAEEMAKGRGDMMELEPPKSLTKKAPKPKVKSKEGEVGFGGGFSSSWFKNLFSRRGVKFDKSSSEVSHSTLQIEQLRRHEQPEMKAQIEKITATSLTKEAKRIKDIMERRKRLKLYQPSFFGELANLTIRRISLFLLDNFPDFFKDLYHALRLANIKILSNTYINMMVLGVLAGFFGGLLGFGFFFGTSGLPLTQILMRTFMMALITGAVTFAIFYSYPYSAMKQRRRSINANLPFAINHMAAVSGSGVSPTKMFKLISTSKEYGEIAVEIEKIVNYVEIFGYDILTSIKAVAAQTPSYQFKDFFEGMISTTQTGGDISAFLSQKAGEAMLNYKLERKKYTETISTYSDIYTGILIAAPLFFVAALSLVSLLGGKIGGVDVNVIIVLGTYVVIPIMNISFITFLTMTQPEI